MPPMRSINAWGHSRFRFAVDLSQGRQCIRSRAAVIPGDGGRSLYTIHNLKVSDSIRFAEEGRYLLRCHPFTDLAHAANELLTRDNRLRLVQRHYESSC
jgi:hypothetical protein